MKRASFSNRIKTIDGMNMAATSIIDPHAKKHNAGRAELKNDDQIALELKGLQYKTSAK